MALGLWAKRGVLVLLLSCFAMVGHADVFRPAYLELREAGGDRYDVLWKVPAQGELRLAMQPLFPPGTNQITAAQPRFSDGAYLERWQIERKGGLVGQVVSIEGKARDATDVIVRVERSDGSSQVALLGPAKTLFTVEAPAGAGEVAWSYLKLGVKHILGGFDHLLFVLALLLIVRGGRRTVTTVTAFTVAHSITLVAATLGWLRVPGPPVEAVIALSIVFVAAEAVHGLRGRPGLTARAPWAVAFTFGLLHGLGFAGALAEVGLPQTAIPVALLMFNLGVEVGQLLFIAATLLVGAAVSRLSSRRLQGSQQLVAYAIGSVAMFWVIERVGQFW